MPEPRVLPDNFQGKIRNDQGITLILVQQNVPVFAIARSDKDDLRARYEAEGGVLLLAWTGRYSTDIFQLTGEKLAAYYS